VARAGRRHLSLRLAGVLASCAVAATLLAGCGSDKGSSSDGTTTISEAANTAYERSYSDCASKQLVDLAHQYNTKQNKQAVAVAVGKYWANRTGGGAEAAKAGAAGCHDGYAFAP
jgi:hypothetical protein